MDFSSGSGGAKNSLNPSERAAIMTNIKQQLDLAHAQEILQHVTEKCFKMCVQKPGSSLSSSDQKCLSNCIERYFDATNIVSKTYGQRVQRELANIR